MSLFIEESALMEGLIKKNISLILSNNGAPFKALPAIFELPMSSPTWVQQIKEDPRKSSKMNY